MKVCDFGLSVFSGGDHPKTKGTGGTLKLADTAAALGSGNAPLPSLPQPWARVLPLVVGSAASRFEATSRPSSGSPKAADLRPNPLTGTAAYMPPEMIKALVSSSAPLPLPLTLTHNAAPRPDPHPNPSQSRKGGDGEGLGPAVDMWAVGVVLYILLGGYQPSTPNPNHPLRRLTRTLTTPTTPHPNPDHPYDP